MRRGGRGSLSGSSPHPVFPKGVCGKVLHHTADAKFRSESDDEVAGGQLEFRGQHGMPGGKETVHIPAGAGAALRQIRGSRSSSPEGAGEAAGKRKRDPATKNVPNLPPQGSERLAVGLPQGFGRRCPRQPHRRRPGLP